MNKENDIKENYSRHLKAIEYWKDITKFFNLGRGIFEPSLSTIHDIVKSGRFQGSKLLEIGSGATVHGIASASAYYPNIVQSDYVEDNCEELKRWLKGESSLDWSDFLNVIATFEEKEGKLDSRRKAIESRIRKAVKNVVRCDVLSDGILPMQELTSDETKPPYDLIISCLTLPAACPDYDTYISVLKRINLLLKPGGGLIICDFVNGDESWEVENKKFNYLKLSLEQFKEALKIAGFGNIEVKCFPKVDSSYDYNFDFYYCLAAEKLA